MNIFLFLRKDREFSECFSAVVEALNPHVGLEYYRSVERLADRLRQPGASPSLGVLVAATRKELADLLMIHELIWEEKVIVVLPDRDPATVFEGHFLRPRFVTFIDRDPTDVAAVLSKMLELQVLARSLKLEPDSSTARLGP